MPEEGQSEDVTKNYNKLGKGEIKMFYTIYTSNIPSCCGGFEYYEGEIDKRSNEAQIFLPHFSAFNISLS